jgi:hypothetical protein
MKMRNAYARMIFLWALTLAGACGAARATTLLRMSLAEMSRMAQAIVRARCAGNSTGWDAGEIWTFTAFDAEEVWHGATPARFTVRLLGGRAGNLTSSVSGVPRFRPGEDVVLFLERTSRGDFSVVSWEQGTFRIRDTGVAAAETVTQDTAAFSTFDPATRRFETEGIRNMPLDSFRAQVYAALRAEIGRKP